MKSYYFGLIVIVVVLSGCTSSKRTSSVEPIYGSTNPTPEQMESAKIKRYGSMIELLPEKEKQYRQLHADVWPQVVTAIKKANIQNYNIFMVELSGKKYLISYMEYTGDDPEKDFASIGDEPTIRDKWWPITDACQKRLPDTPDGSKWKSLEMLMLIP